MHERPVARIDGDNLYADILRAQKDQTIWPSLIDLEPMGIFRDFVQHCCVLTRKRDCVAATCGLTLKRCRAQSNVGLSGFGHHRPIITSNRRSICKTVKVARWL